MNVFKPGINSVEYSDSVAGTASDLSDGEGKKSSVDLDSIFLISILKTWRRKLSLKLH